MFRTELNQHISRCLQRLEKDGHSKEVMDTNRWVTSHFVKYCDEKQYTIISFETISEFLIKQYAINPHETLCAAQISIRRPLLILWEYSRTGNYLKSHLREQTKAPVIFNDLYLEFCNHINSLALNVTTKSTKARLAKVFFSYLEQKGKRVISEISQNDISLYMNSKTEMTYTTKQTAAYNLRQMLNWLYDTGKISFSGFDAFPVIRYPGRKFISSCYTNDEIRRLMDSVDTNTVIDKHDFLVLSLLVYYGLRISDILSLCFKNIQWDDGMVRLIQQKTKKPLELPLIDEIKYPLLDYLKNARPDTGDPHILITLKAPYTPYAKNKSLQCIVVKYMDKAGIDYSNKHRGTHALRYSLASGLLNENIPISVSDTVKVPKKSA